MKVSRKIGKDNFLAKEVDYDLKHVVFQRFIFITCELLDLFKFLLKVIFPFSKL